MARKKAARAAPEPAPESPTVADIVGEEAGGTDELALESEGLTAEEQAAVDAGDDDTPLSMPVTESKPDNGTAAIAAAAEKSVEPAKQDMVPHAALHEAREINKTQRAANEALAAQLADLQSQIATLTKPAETEPPYVDPIEDPDGFRKYTEFQHAKAAQGTADINKNTAAQNAQNQRIRQIAEFEADYRKTEANYDAAYSHLIDHRVNELRNLGRSEKDIGLIIQKDANSIFDAGVASGLNPALLVYQQALARGFVPGAAPAPAAPAQAAAAVVPINPAPAAKIAALTAAQNANNNLANTGGGQQTGELTAQALADMSEEEQALVPAADKRRAMGG